MSMIFLFTLISAPAISVLAETIDFAFGVVEDILDALNFESMKTGDKTELAAMVIKCSKQLKPFLKDIFEGVTDEEIQIADRT
mgnify:CR=1 FL=1